MACSSRPARRRRSSNGCARKWRWCSAQPEFKERLANSGSGEPYVVTPEEFVARMRSDYEKYGKLIRSIGIKIE